MLVDNGRLIINSIIFTKPIACQLGIKHYVDVRYIIKDNGYGFAVEDYDESKELVIDPLIDFRCINIPRGSINDYACVLAIDSNDNVFVVGYTNSYDFQTNGYDDSYNGYDAFISKLKS